MEYLQDLLSSFYMTDVRDILKPMSEAFVHARQTLLELSGWTDGELQVVMLKKLQDDMFQTLPYNVPIDSAPPPYMPNDQVWISDNTNFKLPSNVSVGISSQPAIYGGYSIASDKITIK